MRIGHHRAAREATCHRRQLFFAAPTVNAIGHDSIMKKASQKLKMPQGYLLLIRRRRHVRFGMRMRYFRL